MESAKMNVTLCNLGLVRYKEAWDLQEALLHAALQVRAGAQGPGAIDSYLLVCTHPHVYTLGRHGKKEHLLLHEGLLKARDIEYYRTDRGGDITYHGPGQLVAYPILDLEQLGIDIRRYLYSLEEVVIRTLAEFGITAQRLPGNTGVWIEGVGQAPRKICAMGVRCSRRITIHGLALNMNTDLSYFQGIVPCGLADKGVASMQSELKRGVDESRVLEVFVRRFGEVFGVGIREGSTCLRVIHQRD